MATNTTDGPFIAPCTLHNDHDKYEDNRTTSTMSDKPPTSASLLSNGSPQAPLRTAMGYPIEQTMPTEGASAAVNLQQHVLPLFQVGELFPLQHLQYPPLTYASMISHPSTFLQYDMRHPQQQMTYEQQQALLFQHQLMVQQVAQQSILLQQLQAGAMAASTAAAASVQQPLSADVSSQQLPINQAPLFDSQQIIPPQATSLQYQLQLMHQLQQSQYEAAAFSAAAQSHMTLPSQVSSLPYQQQDLRAMFLQAPPPPPYQYLHPYYWNVQLLHEITPLPAVGIDGMNQGVEQNYQVNNQEAETENDADENVEDMDEDEDDYDDDDLNPTSRTLHRLVEDHQWVPALQRMTTHPHETQQVGIQGRTPLHVACDNDAPPCVVQALLNAWPEGADRVGTSHMNPLHITCSSPHASVDVVRVLLAGCRDPFKLTGAKDVDGDTSLHAACRCAAPMDVLLLLLQANPITVTWKDYEGLNPLMRLWVRYFVLVGEQIISNIKQPSDLTSDLVEAWEKSLLLLRVMDAMERRGRGEQVPAGPFRAVHAASSVNCPRCVVRIAMVLFPEELLRRDEQNRLPIHIAAVSPVYPVHDLRGEGFTLEDAFIDDDPEAARPKKKKSQSKYKEPSVIDILLCGEPKAAGERDPNGQLPLHVAIMRGKTLDEGVQALVEAFPDALTTPDSQTNLYPFMLAASVGRGRGDCGTIYALLRAAPELVLLALTKEDQEDEVKLSPDLRVCSECG